MNLLHLKAKAVRFVFDRFVLPRIGYPVSGLGDTRDEERTIATQVRKRPRMPPGR
jgi:hypothetical protein